MRNWMRTYHYIFTDESLNALDALLELVNYDSLAEEFYDLLPKDLQRDLHDMPWLDWVEEKDAA